MVQQVSGSMIVFCAFSFLAIHFSSKGRFGVCRNLISLMDNKIALLNGVQDFYRFGAVGKHSHIPNLSTCFGIKWGFVKNNLKLLFPLLLNNSVSANGCFALKGFVAHKLCLWIGR